MDVTSSPRDDQFQAERRPDPDNPPALAAGVELIGALPASGFRDSQFLVSRRGQFVQLTELLFRTVEAIDGRRSKDEIAAEVTSNSNFALTGDQVEYLVAEKLLPLGLIATPDDESAAEGVATGAAETPVERSPFMVQAPVQLIGAGAIESVTRLTRHLFAWPVAVALLAAVAAAHAWLFLVHGVGNGFLAVLYAPGLLLVVLGVLVVAGLVHEFGHASGLRHGGRHARSIGAGLYLVYPAFFTDVSEGYTLSRAARLRVDLGGIYFHLLFALALIALYQATGWEFLLFAVLLIDIEALRQFLPLGRLDGYWILADLTGIPDPFSQMLPFLRGMAARTGLKGTKLPALRPWVRRVFIAYIALTLPAVALFLLFLLSRLPVLVGLVWDALRLQASQLSTAAVNGNFITVILAVLQIGLIAFELIATAFILFQLGRLGVRGLVALARGDSRRKATATGIAVVAVAGLAFLWGPHVAGLTAGQGDGVRYAEVTSRAHVAGRVEYPDRPPLGGDHAQVWQNCGFYTSGISTEQAVHSMEHGAVWITYSPGAAEDDLADLRRLAEGRSHVLITPFAANPTQVVATAWGRQLRVERADDARLEQFIGAFRRGSNPPERGAPCEGGAGEPDAGAGQ